MKKTPFDKSANSDDQLLPQYNFNYQKAKPNRFASQSKKPKMKVVVRDHKKTSQSPGVGTRHQIYLG